MGMYVVAVNLSRMLNLFQSAIVTVYNCCGPLKKWLLLSGALYVWWLSLLTSIAVMIVGPVVLRLLYGPEFEERCVLYKLGLAQAFMGDLERSRFCRALAWGVPMMCLSPSMGWRVRA